MIRAQYNSTSPSRCKTHATPGELASRCENRSTMAPRLLRPGHSKTVGLWIACALVLSASSCVPHSPPKPDEATTQPLSTFTGSNVVLVTINGLIRDRLGIYGAVIHTSPNLDSFARYGYAFQWAVTASDRSDQAVAAIVTGCSPGSSVDDSDTRTLAEILASHGYFTISLGATHDATTADILARGYQIYEDSSSIKGAPNLNAGHINGRLASILASPTRPPGPFFAHLIYRECQWADLSTGTDGTNSVRKAAARSRSSPDPYDAVLAYVDEQVDEIYNTIAEAGIGDTLLIVTSDGGRLNVPTGWRDHVTSRSSDGVLLVPWLYYHPTLDVSMNRYYGLVQMTDLFPTTLDLLGIRYDPAFVDGQSRAGVVLGRWRADPSPFVVPISDDQDTPLTIIYEDRWKLSINGRSPRSGKPDGKEARADTSSMTAIPKRSDQKSNRSLALYEYRRDPHQVKNLAVKNSKQVELLLDRLQAWREARTDPRNIAGEDATGEFASQMGNTSTEKRPSEADSLATKPADATLNPMDGD